MDENTQKGAYFRLMEKRKQLNFQGKIKEALAVQDEAFQMIMDGKVSDEEIRAGAYI
jgi:hypothetical protein